MPKDIWEKYMRLSAKSGLNFSWLVRRAMYLSIRTIERETSKIGGGK